MDIRKTNDQHRSTNRVEGTKAIPDAGQPGLQRHADSVQESKDATRETMRELEHAREKGDPVRRDRMELSEQAKVQVRQDMKGEEVRASLVSELREAYNGGSLASSERVESAARRLLGERS